jgi:hypothetical protein
MLLSWRLTAGAYRYGENRGRRAGRTLLNWGVDTVFGLPGDGINGIMEALRTRQDKIRFIQVRHEESAAFRRNAPAYCAKHLARPALRWWRPR